MMVNQTLHTYKNDDFFVSSLCSCSQCALYSTVQSTKGIHAIIYSAISNGCVRVCSSLCCFVQNILLLSAFVESSCWLLQTIFSHLQVFHSEMELEIRFVAKQWVYMDHNESLCHVQKCWGKNERERYRHLSVTWLLFGIPERMGVCAFTLSNSRALNWALERIRAPEWCGCIVKTAGNWCAYNEDRARERENRKWQKTVYTIFVILPPPLHLIIRNH